MTNEQLEQYRRELNTPYTDEELGIHLEDRDAKSLLEMTHAHNYRLIAMTRQWIAFANGTAPRPVRNLWKYLSPGHNHDNSACDRLNQLVEYYSGFEYGSAPVLPIAFFCSRSTMTLIKRLQELHYTPHLITVERAAKDFFAIITNECERNFTRDALRTTLQKSVDDFVTSCEENAKETTQFLLGIIHGEKSEKPATPKDVMKIVRNESRLIGQKMNTLQGKANSIVQKVDLAVYEASGQNPIYKPASANAKGIKGVKSQMVKMAIDRVLETGDTSIRSTCAIVMRKFRGVSGAYTDLKAFSRQTQRQYNRHLNR